MESCKLIMFPETKGCQTRLEEKIQTYWAVNDSRTSPSCLPSIAMPFVIKVWTLQKACMTWPKWCLWWTRGSCAVLKKHWVYWNRVHRQAYIQALPRLQFQHVPIGMFVCTWQRFSITAAWWFTGHGGETRGCDKTMKRNVCEGSESLYHVLIYLSKLLADK